MIGVATVPDPFSVNEFSTSAGGYGWQDTVGRTLQSSVIVAPATTKTIIVGGQSNHATAPGTTLYTTVSSQAQNLNIYDGGIYSGADPVLGATNSVVTGVSSVSMRLMDRLISQGKATRAIAVPIAVGGTIYAQWTPSAANSLFTRLSTAILRSRARGLEPDVIIWAQGETDGLNGTSAAVVTANINAIVDGVRAMGCVAPFYVGKFTMVSGVVNTAVQTGITNSIDNAGRKIFAGYDADTNLTVAGGFRLADQTHLSDTGLAALAIGWQAIIFP